MTDSSVSHVGVEESSHEVTMRPKTSPAGDTPIAWAMASMTSMPDWPPCSILAKALGLRQASRVERGPPWCTQTVRAPSGFGCPFPRTTRWQAHRSDRLFHGPAKSV